MGRTLGIQPKAVLSRLALLIVGTLVGLLTIEGIVRFIEPDLREIVEAKFQRNAYRIHANPKSTVAWRKHPDTGERHAVIFNSLGLRQHREFSTEKSPDSLRFGFFGDSFTANIRLPIEASFTEPLEFLLRESGVAAEVLNFGTDGYGTDQTLLHYEDESEGLGLDTVFYVFCQNDLRDILANELFELSPSGELRYRPRRQSRFWVDIARRFHLTYFLARRSAQLQERLSPSPWDRGTIIDGEEEKKNRRQLAQVLATESSPEKVRAIALFRALMESFKRATEANGQSFRVVLLPRHQEANRQIVKILDELHIETLDLFPHFFPEDGSMAATREDFFFRSDSHWNAAGNELAARILWASILRQLGYAIAPESEVDRWLRQYRAAFSGDGAEARQLDPWSAEIESRYRAIRPGTRRR